MVAMELINTCWERMNISDGDSIKVSNIIEVVRQSTCLQKKCISCLDDQEKRLLTTVPSKYISFISIKSLAEYFNVFTYETENLHHSSCIIELLHILYKDIIYETHNGPSNYKGDISILHDLLILAEKCLLFPDLASPVPLEIECESSQKYNNIIKRNISLTLHSLQFYMDIIFTDINPNGNLYINKNESRVKCLEESSNCQNFILKKSASKALILACNHLGEHPWTNADLKKLCKEVIQCIQLCSKYESITNLLSGIYPENCKVLFPNGLLGTVLMDLMPHCHNEKWKKNIPSIHALIWCLLKVKYPHLNLHIPKLVPALLLLTDDYIIDHKMLGITSLNYLVANVNPADLRLYNHADVIYDALFLQLFSNQHQIYEVTLPCLLKILYVLESKPNMVSGIKYSRWDICFEKVMQNIDMSSNIHTEIVLLKFLLDFINKMDANTIKHLDKIIDLIGSSMHCVGRDDVQKRLYALNILSSSIRVCWPIIKGYTSKILKIIMKILIDFNSDGSTISKVTKDKFEEEICNVLVLVKYCTNDTKETLTTILKVNLDQQFDFVHRVIKRVLESSADDKFVKI